MGSLRHLALALPPPQPCSLVSGPREAACVLGPWQIQTKPHIQPLLRLGPRAPFVPPTMNIRQGAVPQASILGVHWLADVFFSDAFVGLFITSGQGFCSPVHGSCLPYRTADQESPQSPPQGPRPDPMTQSSVDPRG